MTGKLTLKRPRTDSAGNNLVVWGRINGTEQVLLKDYQRGNSSSGDDYINYYGAISANDHLTNKKYVDDTVTSATSSLLPKSDASSTYLSQVDANGTYLKIDDYVPGGGVVGGLPTTGGSMTGSLNSKLGGNSSTSSFRILNTAGTKSCLDIWCPGGVGDHNKFVGRNGTDFWFQCYDDADSDVRTTAKFNYGSYELRATNSLLYSVTDAHYFKGQVRFSSGAGDLKLSQTPSNLDIYTTARCTEGLVVKATGEPITGNNSFAAFPDHTTYNGRQTEDTDIVNKKYIDDKIAALEARIVALGG